VDFKQRVVVVTGASSGIGRATALAFARQGAVVVAVARREALLREVVQECRVDSPESSYLAGDLGQRDFAERVVEDSVKRHGRVDVLVNNAAIPKHKLLYRMSVEEAEDTLRINFFSCLWTTFAVIPPMLEQGGGTVVNVSSFASMVVPTHESLYAASKGAMNGFSRGLWNDLQGSGIHVCLIHPGPIDTEIWDKLGEPGAYSGKLYPPELVADEILAAVRKKRFEVVVPRFNFKLTLARWMQLLAPSLVRSGVARMDPIPQGAVETARERARAGLALGEEPAGDDGSGAGEAR
jgi:short-subunit dehydrogenase